MGRTNNMKKIMKKIEKKPVEVTPEPVIETPVTIDPNLAINHELNQLRALHKALTDRGIKDVGTLEVKMSQLISQLG